MSVRSPAEKPNIFDHWFWVVAALLLAAALTLYQVDNFPPTVDEFASMLDAGWLNGGYTPAETVQSLLLHSASHVPGYYFLLSAWGKLTAYDIALARILGVMLYLLVLTLVYRLARDFVAPVAGLFALVIVVSNAFLNFYIAHARPYTLFVLMSCLTTWLYLRIVYRSAEPTKMDLIALGAAVVALVITHLFSATLLFTLGLYHLFIAPKSRRWLRVGLIIAVAVLLCLPLVALVLSQFATALDHLEGPPLNGADATTIWLKLMLNDQPAPLLLLSIGGLIIGVRKRLIGFLPWLILLPLFLVTLALVSEYASLVRAQDIRHQLDGLILLVLFAAAGHYALYRWKRRLGLLIVFWAFAGLVFQQSESWWHHIGYRAVIFSQPPIQALSRLASQAEPKPLLLGYPYDFFVSYALQSDGPEGAFRQHTQGDHYFAQHGIKIGATDDLDEFAELVGYRALHSPSVWYFHQTSAGSAELAEAIEILRDFNYRYCGTRQIGSDTVINQYMWDLLECQLPSNPSAYQSDLIKHEFYEVGLNQEENALIFIDKWTARKDFTRDSYRMSFQLLTEDWTNVAQLELPLVHEGELRQFSIDVADVAPGSYSLMLVVYDSATGERIPWEGNPGYIPEMLPLSEITISGP